MTHTVLSNVAKARGSVLAAALRYAMKCFRFTDDVTLARNLPGIGDANAQGVYTQ